MRLAAILMLSTVLTVPFPLVAQTHDDHAHRHAREDSAFRAMQARGLVVMGVDQYTSIHRFDALPDGWTHRVATRPRRLIGGGGDPHPPEEHRARVRLRRFRRSSRRAR
jgi:hypothetical protein